MRVAVVGAGLSGLAAADALRCAGVEVVVVEARERLGGRTRTVSLGPGRMDLGASWVHGPLGNPVAEAMAAAGIATRNDGPFMSAMAVWKDGWLDAPAATSLAATLLAGWDPAEARAALGEEDRFAAGIDWYLRDRGLSGSAAELARFAITWIEGASIVAAMPERISLAGAAAYEESDGGNAVPVGGYSRLVESLAAGLDVRLGAEVRTVEHGGDVAAVRWQGGELEADRVIVTVPLGALKAGAPAFDPPLGPEHRDAIERLGMATLEKLVFRFRERFWPESVWQLVRVTAGGSFPVWFDFTRHVGAPTLVAFYIAEMPEMAGRTIAERKALALAALREMFGEVPEPEEVLATDWTPDPLSRGSYSFIPLGAGAADMDRLAAPVSERLLLAGEATVPSAYGTAHAAFGSGLRAAGLVLGAAPERLSLGPVPPHWVAGAS